MFEFKLGMDNLINIGSEDLAKVLNNSKRIELFGGDWSDIDNISSNLTDAKGLAIFLKASEDNFHLDKVGKEVENIVKHVNDNTYVIWGVQKSDKSEVLVLASWGDKSDLDVDRILRGSNKERV